MIIKGNSNYSVVISDRIIETISPPNTGKVIKTYCSTEALKVIKTAILYIASSKTKLINEESCNNIYKSSIKSRIEQLDRIDGAELKNLMGLLEISYFS